MSDEYVSTTVGDDALVKMLREHPYPKLILVDYLKPDAFGHLIHIHQRGSYTHAMMFYGFIDGVPYCVSQGITLKLEPLTKWLGGIHIVKVWYNPLWYYGKLEKAKRRMDKDISRPWFLRLYDAPGIIGQGLSGIGLGFINIPFLWYCSEHAGRILRILERKFKLRRPDPRDLNVWCNRNKHMKVFARVIPKSL